jgi:16S rRNA (guanine1207-N2)-methyltransferase
MVSAVFKQAASAVFNEVNVSKSEKIRSRNRDDGQETGEPAAGLPPRPQEQLLIDRIGRLSPRRALCTTAGRGQFARELARKLSSANGFLSGGRESPECGIFGSGTHNQGANAPRSEVLCLFQDLYPLQQARRDLAEPPPNLHFVCQSDFPPGDADLAVIVASSHGIADLTRDLLQQAHERLIHRGQMLAAIDNPDDQWLHGELKKLFDKVTREPCDEGVVYSAIKTAPLVKRKHFSAEFAFRDRDRIIFLYSRPGVFSHRRLDVGARALINAMEIHPKMRVLDLGCGSGAVGIAAALRQPEAEIRAVDSNPRAIECTQLGAQRNNVANLTTCLDADGSNIPAGDFDLVLANPPYYSHYRLAELFLQTTTKSLNERGELLLVTKAPAWFRENLPDWFRDVDERMQKEYHVFACRRPIR